MSDGIEIHHDTERGYLELACEPDAFAAYRELARQHLVGIPDIDIDKVVEINIVDTTASVRRRKAPRRRFGEVVFVVLLVLIFALAIIGAIAVVSHFLHHVHPTTTVNTP